MIKLSRLLTSMGLWLLLGAIAHAGTVHYYYTDPQGSVLAKTDAQGNVIATNHYQPYGGQSLGAVTDGPGYTGHVEDADTGLVYMQARYYDPGTGQFLSPDPVGPEAGNAFNFNRYDYTNNNPINHNDPDGRCIDGVTCGTMLKAHVDWRMSHPGAPADGMEKAAVVAVGVMAAPVVAALAPEGSAGATVLEAAEGAKVLGKVLSDSPETELVQRGMSKAELNATQDSGLVRGGRSGTHYASDAVNSSAGRAQQRLALPTKPEVRVTLEVPTGRFSAPTRVEPNFNMPGGGMERTATGDVPATVVRTDTMQQ